MPASKHINAHASGSSMPVATCGNESSTDVDGALPTLDCGGSAAKCRMCAVGQIGTSTTAIDFTSIREYALRMLRNDGSDIQMIIL